MTTAKTEIQEFIDSGFSDTFLKTPHDELQAHVEGSEAWTVDNVSRSRFCNRKQNLALILRTDCNSRLIVEICKRCRRSNCSCKPISLFSNRKSAVEVHAEVIMGLDNNTKAQLESKLERARSLIGVYDRDIEDFIQDEIFQIKNKLALIKPEKKSFAEISAEVDAKRTARMNPIQTAIKAFIDARLISDALHVDHNDLREHCLKSTYWIEETGDRFTNETLDLSIYMPFGTPWISKIMCDDCHSHPCKCEDSFSQ